jgi:murein DD-endopeptidase MepM/ murein hydrolase activator NlpD
LPVVRRTLAIAPRAWQIEHVNAPFRPGGLADADFARKRAGELAAINASRAQSTDATGWRQTFAWPLRGAIRGRFGAQRIYQGKPGSYHGGLDIAGAEGTPFNAPADGVVVLAATAPFTLEGNLLIVDHGSGLSSAFLHASRLAVRTGDRVRQGQLIGWVGKTGRATGPHLHWALKWRESKLDPLLFVQP